MKNSKEKKNKKIEIMKANCTAQFLGLNIFKMLLNLLFCLCYGSESRTVRAQKEVSWDRDPKEKISTIAENNPQHVF